MKNTDLKKIIREGIDPNPLYGFVLTESDELLLVAREFDFYLDGFQICRKQDVSEIVSSDSTQYVCGLLEREGLLNTIDRPLSDVENWESVFGGLGSGEFVTVEDEAHDDMLIGPITGVGPTSMTLHYFDGTGQWMEEESINYADITTVEFRTNYLNVHRKYIGERNGH